MGPAPRGALDQHRLVSHSRLALLLIAGLTTLCSLSSVKYLARVVAVQHAAALGSGFGDQVKQVFLSPLL